MAVLTPRRRRPRWWQVAAVTALVLVGSRLDGASIDRLDEYQVKAAFLYQFTRFVEWPPEAFADARMPVRICLAGDDTFGKLVSELLVGKTVGGRSLETVRLPDAPVRGCHLLFVGVSERQRAPAILRAAMGLPVFTVGEIPGFARDGGTANFVIESSRVRFEINPAAAERSRLKVSSKLLALARLVGPGDTAR